MVEIVDDIRLISLGRVPIHTHTNNKRTPAHETERTYLAIRHPRADYNVLDLLI
jgi:hypothetical protein